MPHKVTGKVSNMGTAETGVLTGVSSGRSDRMDTVLGGPAWIISMNP